MPELASTRATQLTAYAAAWISGEVHYKGPLSVADVRDLTKACLRDQAAELGFEPDEIESAVENAIKAASKEEAHG